MRIIAATNRNLKQATASGDFREDLYYRINVFPITLPSLRDRVDDIPLLVRHFTQRYDAKMGKHIDQIPQRVMSALQAYDWPGNMRELENIVERAVILSSSATLDLDLSIIATSSHHLCQAWYHTPRSRAGSYSTDFRRHRLADRGAARGGSRPQTQHLAITDAEIRYYQAFSCSVHTGGSPSTVYAPPRRHLQSCQPANHLRYAVLVVITLPERPRDIATHEMSWAFFVY